MVLFFLPFLTMAFPIITIKNQAVEQHCFKQDQLLSMLTQVMWLWTKVEVTRLLNESGIIIRRTHNTGLQLYNGFDTVTIHDPTKDWTYTGTAYPYNFSGLEVLLSLLGNRVRLKRFSGTGVRWFPRIAKWVPRARKATFTWTVFVLVRWLVLLPFHATCSRPVMEVPSQRVALRASHTSKWSSLRKSTLVSYQIWEICRP